MKKNTFKKFIAFAFCTFFFSTIAIAQQRGLLSKISLEDQIESSAQIVEGKVISKKSYWDENHQKIYTVNEVEVYKVFKGQSLATIEVITPGGFVGFDGQKVSPSLGLSKNDIGIFMLYRNAVVLSSDALTNNTKFMPFSSVQGFYKYNKHENTAVNPFHIKEGIKTFYDEIKSLIGRDYVSITDFDIDVFTTSNSVLAVAIISISPTTSSAGTGSVLTITGTGFGVVKGTVSFRDGNDGGATYYDALETQILTWGDAEITVEIPSRAGTGDVRVTEDGGVSSDTSETLTISYAESNYDYDWVEDPPEAPVFYAYQSRHKDINGSGGYTWQMQTDFAANTVANESFMRAFDTWRCETDINWVRGENTTTDVAASDGINVIRFDNGAELPSGVLGRCTSYVSADCGITDVILYWFVAEMDIVFNDTTNWEFGPSAAVSPKVDFETVAVHELGHGHQLVHVIDATAIMHWSLGAGDNNRALSANDIAGGNDVMSRSIVDIGCAPVDGMIALTTCVGIDLSVENEELARSIELYPNPATNSLQISNKLYLNLEAATIYDISGREISTTIISAYGSQTIDVSHLSKGLYFISITSDKAKITKRFIVQ